MPLPPRQQAVSAFISAGSAHEPGSAQVSLIAVTSAGSFWPAQDVRSQGDTTGGKAVFSTAQCEYNNGMESSTFPKRLADFQILRELGRGGMGIVYEARQMSLNRKVALKVLSSSLGLTARSVLRFRREAEAAAKLHHTNIVPIYATGEEHGVHYYAMELVDGPSLDQVIRHAREQRTPSSAVEDDDATVDPGSAPRLPEWATQVMALEERKPGSSPPPDTQPNSHLSGSGSATGTRYFDAVATMIADVADALDHAHEQGVIHRDIKPSNLLLGRDGRLSVNDFGLARILEQPGMTISGEFVGTPRYMSPEQITAGRAPLDHRTDIYSLGATLYELLTLQPPFPGKTREEVIAQILHKEPKSPRRLNRRIPTDLETICLKAIDRDPDRRYAAAGQMAADLRAYVNRFAISAKRAGGVARAWKCVRRHPAGTFAVLLLVVVCSLAAWLGYQWFVGKRLIREQQLSFAKERAFEAAIAGNFGKAEGYIPELTDLGAEPGWIRMLQGQIALCRGQHDTAIQELQAARRLLGDNLTALALLTRAYMDGGDEIFYYVHVDELRRREALSHEEHLFKGWALSWGHPDEAIKELDKAYVGNSTSLLTRLLRCHARCWYAMDNGNLDEAQAVRNETALLRRDLPENPIPFSVNVVSSILTAHLLRESGNGHEADRVLAEVDIEPLDLSLLAQEDVRWARFQYFLQTGQEEKTKEEASRVPLKNTGVYLALWEAAELYRQGELAEAMKFCTLGIGLGRESQSKFVEAFIRMDHDNPADILTDFKSELPSRETSLYLIFDWVALRLLGDTETAQQLGRRLLKMALDRRFAERDITLTEFAAGDSDTAELESVTGKSRRFDCGAFFVLGVDALADGRRQRAAAYFRRCEATGYFAFYDYLWSVAFAERIESGRPWLTWLPDKPEDSREQSTVAD